MYKVPESVKKDAKIGLELHKKGFVGGTTTGWNRAKQLINSDSINYDTVKIMKAWFSRHGPKAKNGGTSYPGYKKWVANGKPMTLTKENKSQYRGAVAWLIWGGDAGYKWIESL